MMIGIELKKLKSTGFFTSFFAGGILAALVPVANTAFRTELFTSMEGSPLSILLDANLQMMTMLFLILIICGACLMYHSEYADHAMRRMLALPLHPESLFFGKALILAAGLLFLLVLSSLSLTFCTLHSFEMPEDFFPELARNMGFLLLLTLPTLLFMLLAASACQNMWVSLGIGVIFMSMGTVLPEGPFLLTLVPFITPFKTFYAAGGDAGLYAVSSCVELLLLSLAACLFIRTRRYTL